MRKSDFSSLSLFCTRISVHSVLGVVHHATANPWGQMRLLNLLRTSLVFSSFYFTSISKNSTSPFTMAYQPPGDPSLLSPTELTLFRSLTTHQKVLIAQGCYAKGNRDWKGVSDMLKGHTFLQGVGEDWFQPKVGERSK